MPGDVGVGGKADPVGVAVCNVRGAGWVARLYVNNDERLRAVKVDEDNVGAVAQASACRLIPLLQGATPVIALGDDAMSAEGGIQDRDQGADGGIVAGGRGAHAIGAGREVTVTGEDGPVRLTSAGGAATDTIHRREEEEVNGEGDGEGGCIWKGEEGAVLSPRRLRDRHAPPEAGGTTGGRGVEEPGAAGGGGGVVERQELK